LGLLVRYPRLHERYSILQDKQAYLLQYIYAHSTSQSWMHKTPSFCGIPTTIMVISAEAAGAKARVCISTSSASSFTCQILGASFFHVAFLYLQPLARSLTRPHDRLNVHHTMSLSYQAVVFLFPWFLPFISVQYSRSSNLELSEGLTSRQHDPVSRWQQQHLVRNRLSLAPSLWPWNKVRRLLYHRDGFRY
jgi:hypothetical protein